MVGGTLSNGGVSTLQYDNGDDQDPGKKASDNPDVLRDLVNQSRGLPLDVQHITGTEIKALRNTHERASAANVGMARAFASFFSGLFGGLFALFSPPVQKKSQCQMYGHVRPAGGWTGVYPKCVECGANITSESDLRGSSARQ